MPDMIEVVIDSVRVSLMSPQRVVVLRQVDAERFVEPASVALYGALKNAQGMISDDEVPLDRVLAAVQSLIPAINTFFEAVMVMDKDLTLRENRLGMLQEIAALTQGVVDLTKLEGF